MTEWSRVREDLKRVLEQGFNALDQEEQGILRGVLEFEGENRHLSSVPFREPLRQLVDKMVVEVND